MDAEREKNSSDMVREFPGRVAVMKADIAPVSCRDKPGKLGSAASS